MTRRTWAGLILLGLVLAGGPSAAHGREWVDRTGKFRVEAEFVKLEDGLVYLKKPGGKTLKPIPLERLSAEDQEFARKAAAGSAPSGSGASPADEAAAADSPTDLPAAGGPLTLVWKFTAGEVLPYEAHIQMDVEIKTPSQPVKIGVDVVQYLKWTVREVDDSGTATIGYRFERFAGQMKPPFGNLVKFDTAEAQPAQGNNPVMAAMVAPLKNLVGNEILLKVNAQGQVLETTIPESLKQANFARGTQGPVAASGSMTDPEQITAQLRSLLGFLPLAPVTVGAKWSKPAEHVVPSGGKVTGTSEYTFEGTETRGEQVLAKIVGVESLTFEPAQNAPATGSPASPLVTIAPEPQETTYLFDSAGGRLIESHSKGRQRVTNDMGPNQKNETTISVALDVRYAGDDSAGATATGN